LRIKTKKTEKLTKANIAKVIGFLEGENPITKKEACGILNIAYNTTRLDKIILDYKEDEAHRAMMRSRNRGKGATEWEIQQAVSKYMQGFSIQQIANSLYRSNAFIKSLIERVGVPQKQSDGTYYLPDECMAEEFSAGERVWSAKYNAPAIVEKEIINMNYVEKYGSKCYHIYVLEKGELEKTFFSTATEIGFHAAQLAYDLGSLRHLEKYGVNI
jgi:hypothetical protein